MNKRICICWKVGASSEPVRLVESK